MAQTTMFYLPDERGNTAMRLDRNGTILSAHVTDAFGATKTSDYVGSSTDDPFAGFGGSLGYMRESGLDLYRCGLRFYDVANARWLTRDPIGYGGGQNLYGYVSGNPVMAVDPFGLQPPISSPQTPHGAAELASIAKDEAISSGEVVGYGRGLMSNAKINALEGTPWATAFLMALKNKFGDQLVKLETDEAPVAVRATCTYLNKRGKEVIQPLVARFDGKVGNVFLEFKTLWKESSWKDDRDQILTQFRVANSQQALYCIISQQPFPGYVREFMNHHGIKGWEPK